MTNLPVRGAEVLQALLEEGPLQSSDFVTPDDSKSTTDYNYTLRQLEERDLVKIEDGQRADSGGNAPNVAHLTERGRNRAEVLSGGEETIVRIQKADDQIEELASEISTLRADIRDAGMSGQEAHRELDKIEERLEDVENRQHEIRDDLDTNIGSHMQKTERFETAISGISDFLEQKFGKTISHCEYCYQNRLGDAGQNQFVCDHCS